MEENKASAVKQAQTGDDSGYSCTSTRSKHSAKSCHSQSASSGDSCFEERRILTTLKTSENRKMSTLNSKSSNNPNQTLLRDLSEFETTTNQEINDTNSKSEQENLSSFESQMDQSFHIDELKQPLSITKLEIDDSNHLNDTGDHDRNNTFLQLATLCQSYHDYLIPKPLNSNDDSHNTTDSVLNEFNKQESQLKQIIKSNEDYDDSFGVIVSMHDGLIVNTSNSIHASMGYPKDMWQGRSFIDFIHSRDRISFISYVTSILTDPCTISRRDNTSTVTFLKAKNNDGFYCNIRRYRGLNTGYSIYPQKNHYQVCKLTITLKNESYSSTSSNLEKTNNGQQSQLHLIVKAQLINSAYTYPDERKENPLNFITKHNALFEWCYVDHLIISHFGYLPQNIIGKSIFGYYNIEDLTTIKEIHENMTTARSVPYKGKPYRFKCQNGDFALVQTEWSNFVNPWSGRVEFVIGRHKVIQGPINPDVTTPIDDVISESKIAEDKNNYHEIYEDIKKILNKTVHKTTDVSHQIDQSTNLNTNVKRLLPKYKNSELFINCQEDLPEVEVQPETCGRFSDRDSVMLGEISPHHNYESKSSSGTPPSYTQLNYNDNIQRFFKSNLKTNSSEYLSDGSYPTEMTTGEVNHIDTDMYKAQHTSSLLQNVTPSSSIKNHTSNYYSEKSSYQNSQLTQKMLLRHNKKMEDDLVKQHKNNSKKIKSSEKQKQNLLDETSDTPDVTHGIKRSNPSAYESKPYKLTKRNLINNNSIDVITQKQENKEVTITHTRSTQIWPPCQITRDSQATIDLPKSPTLPSQVLCYNVPLSNNVMPVKHNTYENVCTLMDSHEHNQESVTGPLQPLPVPLYATIPVMNHIPKNSLILQPYLHYHNQLLLQPYQNIPCNNKMDLHNENSVPKISNTFYQTMNQNKTKDLQVNQEEVITSSDSECKKEMGSLKSSSGWMYDDSSFYSSSLRDKTDISSEREECSWPPEFNIANNFCHQFIKKKPFWVEEVITTPDLIYRYQMEHKDINEVLRKDMNALNTLTQPLLVNEQLKQLYVELDVNGASKTYMEDGTSSSSGGDECLIAVGKNKKRKIDFCRMAMIYEENAPLPPPTSTLTHMSSSNNQSTA